MNEMDLLSELRAEVPDQVSAGAESRFHEALLNELAHSRDGRRASRRDRRGTSWPRLSKLSLATGLALALAAVATAFVVTPHSPSHRAALVPYATPTVRMSNADMLTVADLTERASAAALARKPVAPTQWLYIKLTSIVINYDTSGNAHVYSTTPEDTWQRADNQQMAEVDLGQRRMYQGSMEYVGFAELSSLPTSPRALAQYVYGKVPSGSGSNRWVQTFEGLVNLFDYYNMASATAAEIIQAFQYIPGVQVATDPGDVAFSLDHGALKALFDPTTYRLMGISSSSLRSSADPKPVYTDTVLQAPGIPVAGPFVQP